jgi:hypothetical protein
MDVRKILSIDSVGGLAAGFVVLVFHRELAVLENLPPELLAATGSANVVYGLYSGWLALRAARSPFALRVLVVGNSVWAVLCLALAAITWWGGASWLGTAHLAGEALYVGVLAGVEYRIFPLLGADD